MTFATRVRSILRQDPDIIMIGEIRDEETAQIAIRAAITGHLVFSTLHTNDAPGAVIRLEDMGITDYLVADAVVGVIAQRLVKRLCPACKKRAKTNAREMEMMGITEPVTICRPQGCSSATTRGTRGGLRSTRSCISTRNSKTRSRTRSLWISCASWRRKTAWCRCSNACKQYVLKGVTSIQELMGLKMEQ